jgi:hypothetical protein
MSYQLKASGHASDEWKRCLNMTPDQLQKLFTPLGGQTAEDVKKYRRHLRNGLL